ncbi:MAG: VapE family protein [Polyangiaceae bacterium]|nr:VapE family protein [Polyangiaceae bacterium]
MSLESLNPLLRAALDYANRGWYVLPCKARDKTPATAHGFKDATIDRDQLVAHWRRVPSANVGIATGRPSGIVVLDVDPRNGGHNSLKEIIRTHGALPETATVETGGGGQHYYFALPADVVGAKSFVLAPGLDVKGAGGYVLAPGSVHPSGGAYTWTLAPENTPLADAPAWLFRAARDKSLKKPAPNQLTAASVADASATPLGRLFAESMLLGKALDEGKWSVVCPWQQEHSGGKLLDTSTVIFAASSPGAIGGFHCSHSHCASRSAKDAFDELRRTADSLQSANSWMSQLTRSDKGVLKCNFRNVCTILANDEAYGTKLRFDEMNLTTYLGSDEIRDPTISAIRVDVDKRYGIGPSEADTVRAVQYVAEKNRFHPVRTYLKGLAWDGTKRIERVAKEVLRARVESEEEGDLLTAILRRWFIALVARPLKPGSKVDTVMILVGRQGCGKSSFFRIMGAQWFSDTDMSLDKDGLMQLGGSWIYEWGELENMFGRNTTSRIKQFVASDRDKFRPPFGRAPITVLRTSIIVGTTNLDSFLHDATGSRRFWVVPVGDVDQDLLRDWRDQLLAEAVAAFRSGEKHWLTEAEELRRQEFVGQFNETDPWEGVVIKYAEAQSSPRIPDILQDALKIPTERLSRREEQRVAAILRRNGWEPTQRRIDGKQTRFWARRR